MASKWRQNTAGLRRAFSENLGFFGARNLAAWTVAGTLAYYLWINPKNKAEQLRQEELARRKEWAKARGLEEVDRVRPKPDPQVTGLMRSHKRSERED